MAINDELLNKLRMDAAGAAAPPPEDAVPAPEEEQFGLPMGEGLGKLSPDEIEAGRMVAKTLPREVLQALMSLPEEELEAMLTKQLAEEEVDDVDIPDIIMVIKGILSEESSPMGADEGGIGIDEEE